MAVTTLSYERMVEDALRGVLRKALQLTATQGLPGSHHFYITFDTTHHDVRMAESLRALHPSEMTIVLQNQFWDLKVTEEEFEITLSFTGVSHKLKIPFAAVTAFADPHAKFGLQFHVEFEERSAAEEEAAKAKETADRTVEKPVAAPKEARKPAVVAVAKAEPDGDGKIVTLDAFRKK